MSQKYNPFLNTKSPRSMDTPLETYGRTYGRKFFLLEDTSFMPPMKGVRRAS